MLFSLGRAASGPARREDQGLAAGDTTRRTAGVRTRGRAADVVERVLTATGEELSRAGYAALRVEDVAARSGVNKTTIYRRWPNKAELVAAALREITALPAAVDTGNLREDLRSSLLQTIAFATEPVGRGLMRMMQTERADPEVDAIARTLRSEQRSMRVAMVERGIARGELPPGTNAELLVDLVSAPVLTRAVTFGEIVDERYIDSVLDLVLAGARVSPLPRGEGKG
jgi:AcrR family transcriptional regulator